MYNKDERIASFEGAMVKLRPHVSARVLTTIGLTAWNKYGKSDVDPLQGRVRVVEVHGQAVMTRPRLICLLAVVAALAACATSPASRPDSFYRCDRNGEREQRVACEP